MTQAFCSDAVQQVLQVVAVVMGILLVLSEMLGASACRFNSISQVFGDACRRGRDVGCEEPEPCRGSMDVTDAA